jgi:hypothetical protein
MLTYVVPQVEDEFASDTSNSTDMWERRDVYGRLLPQGMPSSRFLTDVC